MTDINMSGVFRRTKAMVFKQTPQTMDHPAWQEFGSGIACGIVEGRITIILSDGEGSALGVFLTREQLSHFGHLMADAVESIDMDSALHKSDAVH